MVAGAFAGIAVRQTPNVQGSFKHSNTDYWAGTYGYVSH
jgi:hypothetical protein